MLTARCTGDDPYFFTPLNLGANGIATISSGGYSLLLRYRAKQEIRLQVYWGSSSSGFSETNRTSHTVRASGDSWQDVLIPFDAPGALNALRLDPDLANGELLEIESILLQRLDSSQFLTHVIEIELARLAAEISADPASPAKFLARGTFYSQIGRWREAASDFTDELKRNPADRISWFRTANALWLSGE